MATRRSEGAGILLWRINSATWKNDFRKMGRSQMSHGNPRPIKQALAQPVFQRPLTLGVKPGKVLGHSR